MRKIYSLKKNSLFKKVFKEGKKYSDSSLRIYILPSDEKMIKLGISIPKKIKGAVIRNRIKRRLREIVRIVIDDKVKEGYNIVIVPDIKIKDISFQELSLKFENIFLKEKLL